MANNSNSSGSGSGKGIGFVGALQFEQRRIGICQ